MFQQLISVLLGSDWGTKVPGPDGQLHDTGVKQFAETLAATLQQMSEGQLQISQPITIVNLSQGPAIIVQQAGGSAAAIQADVPSGQSATFGVGLGNQGVVASEFVPNPVYALPPESISQSMSTLGANGGAVTPVAGEGFEPSAPRVEGTLSGTGPTEENMPPNSGSGDVGHGYRTLPAGFPILIAGVNNGAGPLAGHPRRVYVTAGGGGAPSVGGADVYRGLPLPGVPVTPTFSAADFLGNIHMNSDGFMEGRINNITILWQTGSSGGVSGSQTVVTAVSCDGGSLSVTTESMTFVKGLYTGLA